MKQPSDLVRHRGSQESGVGVDKAQRSAEARGKIQVEMERLGYNQLRRALASHEGDVLRAHFVELGTAELPKRNSLARQNMLWSAFVGLGHPATGKALENDYVYDPRAEAERVLDVLWWEWVRLGFAVPELQAPHAGPNYAKVCILQLHFTDVGIAALRSAEGGNHHPMSPAFRGALDGIADEPRARLEDAAACFASNILRAAVVMIGLAYECVVLDVLPSFGIHKAPREHAERLDQLLKRLEGSGLKDDTRRQAAVTIAEARTISDARNNAAHPGRERFERADVEDYLRHAPRHLRILQGLKAATTS